MEAQSELDRGVRGRAEAKHEFYSQLIEEMESDPRFMQCEAFDKRKILGLSKSLRNSALDRDE